MQIRKKGNSKVRTFRSSGQIHRSLGTDAQEQATHVLVTIDVDPHLASVGDSSWSMGGLRISDVGLCSVSEAIRTNLEGPTQQFRQYLVDVGLGKTVFMRGFWRRLFT